MITATIWLLIGAYTYYVLCCARSHLLKQPTLEGVIKGFMFSLLLGPFTPLFILYIDIKDDD